jgi:hypothetical protein
MFAAEAWDRPELTIWCRHLDIEGAIALRRYLEWPERTKRPDLTDKDFGGVSENLSPRVSV